MKARTQTSIVSLCITDFVGEINASIVFILIGLHIGLICSYISRISKTSLTAERVAKVVPERSFSVALHPSETKILAATGDKWGHLGLFDVVSYVILS